MLSKIYNMISKIYNIYNIYNFWVSTSFALKSNLASLNTEVDKLDIAKLKPVLVDLSKLCDVVM